MMVTEAEYQRLMRVAVLDRAKAIAEAEQKFKQRVESLRSIRELLQLETSADRSGPGVKHGDITTRVKIALAKMPEEFTFRQLCEAVRAVDAVGEAAAAKAISAAIRRLDGSRVQLIETGKGKRGSKYKRLTGELNVLSKSEM